MWERCSKITGYKEKETVVCESYTDAVYETTTYGIASGSKVGRHGFLDEYWMYSKASTFASGDVVTVWVSTEYTFDSSTGMYTLSSPKSFTFNWGDLTVSPTYMELTSSSGQLCYMVDMYKGTSMLRYYNANSIGYPFTIRHNGTIGVDRSYAVLNVRWTTPDSDASFSFKFCYGCYTAIVYSKGSTVGNISSASSSAYPTNSYSGDYWYVYQGSDSIDPTAVGYSTTSPVAGHAITIKATASSNTYGGTITYQYEVSLDGGTTWTAVSKTTATSVSYTIPKGTTSFAARVKASDNMGFTSTDYVTGAALTVRPSGIYAGVAGVVRNPDVKVGVGGVVKTNVTAYQGVGGVVRQS